MNKTALISGGTSGIGRATAKQLLQDGFNVVVFSRDRSKVKKLQLELAEHFLYDRFLVLTGDIVREPSIKIVIAKTLKTFGKINVLFNNAGYGYFTEADKVDIKKFQAMLATNLIGQAILTKHVVPLMKKQKSGSIINLVSISGKRALNNGEFYSATKFGLMGYSEGIRDELKSFGIKVSTVCPGMVKTNFFEEEELNTRIKQLKMGKRPKLLDAEDVARVVGLIANQSAKSDIQDIVIMPAA
ncbi:MAG: SDR family oxidoreductase [Candidatus Komeilibacteria bacterium]|nr:SDR family oxidoreductase [Candidatus Komeilibacteria bacterium]